MRSDADSNVARSSLVSVAVIATFSHLRLAAMSSRSARRPLSVMLIEMARRSISLGVFAMSPAPSRSRSKRVSDWG